MRRETEMQIKAVDRLAYQALSATRMTTPDAESHLPGGPETLSKRNISPRMRDGVADKNARLLTLIRRIIERTIVEAILPSPVTDQTTFPRAKAIATETRCCHLMWSSMAPTAESKRTTMVVAMAAMRAHSTNAVFLQADATPWTSAPPPDPRYPMAETHERNIASSKIVQRTILEPPPVLNQEKRRSTTLASAAANRTITTPAAGQVASLPSSKKANRKEHAQRETMYAARGLQ